MPQDKLTAIRIKQQNGQYGPQIPVGARAENVQYNNEYSVKDILGNVKITGNNAAPLQEQIDNINTETIQAALEEVLDEWKQQEQIPVTAVAVDPLLTTQGEAADAYQAGKVVTINSETDGNATKVHFNTTNQTVNVLTTDDIDFNNINALAADFVTAMGTPGYTITSLNGYERLQGFIKKNDNLWHNITTLNSPPKYIIIPIEKTGGSFYIKAQDDHSAYYAFLSNYQTPVENGQSPSFCDSPYDILLNTSSGGTGSGIVPDDAKYLYITETTDSGTNVIPIDFKLRIPDIKGDLKIKGDSALKIGSWQKGTVTGSSGSVTTSTTTIVTTNLININENIIRFFTDNSHKFRIYGWNDEEYQGFWVGNGYQKTGSAVSFAYNELFVQELLSKGTKKIRVALVRTDNETITTSDGYSFRYEADVSYINKNLIDSTQALINIAPSPYNHGVFNINKCDYSDWYYGLQSEYGGFNRETHYTDVLNAYDDLLDTYPNYITKNDLGVSSQPDVHLFEYIFKPKQKINKMCAEKMPCIYMDGSIHGAEKCSTYGVYYFMKDICENWDKNNSLRNLHSCVEFHIIPVVNPYGFDGYADHIPDVQYYNANGVNLNRNFDSRKWNDMNDQHKGTSAFSQNESNIIKNWLLAGQDNILMYCNCHTQGGITNGISLMNACIARDDGDEYYNKLFKVFGDHINKQTFVISETYSAIRNKIKPTEMVGSVGTRNDNSVKIGTASAWASVYANLLAMTLETFNGVRVKNDPEPDPEPTEGPDDEPAEDPDTEPVTPQVTYTTILEPYSSDALKLNSEIIGNLILQILSEYAPH